MLAFTPYVSAFAPESRAERLSRERRERTEQDREWRLKYEADWKEYLSAKERVYRRWVIATRDERKQFQMYRASRGMKPLPWRFMHR